MPRYIATADQSRLADRIAIEEYGIPSLILMEHAAMAMCDLIHERQSFQSAGIVCGPGNNGADGMAMARLFFSEGKTVHVYLDFAGRMSSEQITQLNILQNLQIPLFSIEEFRGEEEILIDAMFGSGLSRPICGEWEKAVETFNQSRRPVFSVDIPSGLNGTTGEIQGCAVLADVCMALDCVKTGMIFGKGPSCVGEIVRLDIGIPELAHAKQSQPILFVEPELISSLFFERSSLLHKGSFGKVLLCGGSSRMQGALSMAGQSCFQAGCGTLTLFTPEPAAQAVRARTDLAMIIGASSQPDGYFDTSAAEELNKVLLEGRFSILAGGNGMGTGEGSSQIIETLMATSLPLVLDADGLTILSRHMEWLQDRSSIILTPHIAEFARMMKCEPKTILQDPLKSVNQFCQKWPEATLVLKSSYTIIAKGNQRAILYCPTSALSKGGSGDVLCGLITGLYAQCHNPWQAALLGAWIHNQAAQQENVFSFTPLDLIQNLPAVFEKLANHQQ